MPRQALPGLLTELKSGKFDSLLWLLEIPGAKPPAQLRTVGLREALDRVRTWVTSDASRTDLDTMVGMRDGTVHAAQSDEVEEQLLVAFVQQADALLADLGRSPLEFWQVQIEVVEALLADATDKVRHRVEVRAAAAVAAYNQQYGEGTPEGVLEAVQKFAAAQPYERNQQSAPCPMCESAGIATGALNVDYEPEYRDGEFFDAHPFVYFKAERFACRICGFHLDSVVEWKAVGMESRWEVEGVNWREIDPPLNEDQIAAAEDGADTEDA